MIDWFVLLTPLVLLPIFLLLVFVGCAAVTGLDDFSVTSYTAFGYVKGLKDKVNSIVWSFEVVLEPGGIVTGTIGGGPSPPPTTYSLTSGQIDDVNGGEIPDGYINIESEGSVTCHCTVTKAGASSSEPELTLTKDKYEDEPPPTFTLALDGSGNFILI